MQQTRFFKNNSWSLSKEQKLSLLHKKLKVSNKKKV